MGDKSLRNATLTELKPNQIQALEALLLGETVTNAAEKAGVDRSTIHRWLSSDYAFQATLNSRKAELIQAVGTRLIGLAQVAADSLEQALREGDGRIALSILRGLGLVNDQRPWIGSSDPGELERNSELSKRERENDLRLREMLTPL